MIKKTAIALHYPKNAPAPFILFKSTGCHVKKMLEIAQEHDIPIVNEPETALILSMHDVGECVPVETYEVIASIFAFLKKVEEHDRN